MVLNVPGIPRTLLHPTSIFPTLSYPWRSNLLHFFILEHAHMRASTLLVVFFSPTRVLSLHTAIQSSESFLDTWKVSRSISLFLQGTQVTRRTYSYRIYTEWMKWWAGVLSLPTSELFLIKLEKSRFFSHFIRHTSIHVIDLMFTIKDPK